jgi:hypothetical protein
MEPAPAPAAAVPPPADLALATAERWRAAVAAVRQISVRHAASLAFGRLVRLGNGEVALAFPRDAGFHRATVVGSGRGLVEKALSEHFGRPTRILEEALEAASSAPISLAEEQAKDRADREKSLESEIRHHPAVLAALRILGGEVESVEVFDKDRPVPTDELPEDGS